MAIWILDLKKLLQFLSHEHAYILWLYFQIFGFSRNLLFFPFVLQHIGKYRKTHVNGTQFLHFFFLLSYILYSEQIQINFNSTQLMIICASHTISHSQFRNSNDCTLSKTQRNLRYGIYIYMWNIISVFSINSIFITNTRAQAKVRIKVSY